MAMSSSLLDFLGIGLSINIIDWRNGGRMSEPSPPIVIALPGLFTMGEGASVVECVLEVVEVVVVVVVVVG